MSLGPLNVFPREVTVQVLCPFFNWVVCLPGVESCEFFIYFGHQDQKTMVHLHNGILCSREKEGAYTLCNSMDGTGEHYAKRNKPSGEGQIPYDLTFNWNIINKRKKANKI